MRQEINITTDQIKIGEKLLLPQGKTFDQERVAFIKDLSTMDLHAVPGSGKTTALLAKLIALEQHLPFTDKSGILVISHTNAAVEEIRDKIAHICPRLFSYPNFVGTIQAFVDNFLAMPYYKMLYKRRVVRIDDEIYYENHHPDNQLQAWLNRRADGKKLLYDYRLTSGQLVLGLSNTPFPFGATTATYQKILRIKNRLRDNGFLCFDDGYILAQEYMAKFPAIINILRKRFRYVFVDEMQDMYQHQYNLMETLFGTATEVAYQRIGDKNQAIFNSDSEILDIWQERNVKELNGSHRLHERTARIVERVALSPINVVGYNRNTDGSSIEINPVLLVYDNNSVEGVIPCFAGIIRDLIAEGKIDPVTQNVYKAVAWTTSKPNDGAHMIKLNQYFPGYERDYVKLKINYPCLESYLHFYDKGVTNLASIRKSILNGVLRTLRIEGVNNPIDLRAFTKKSLVAYIKQEKPDDYNAFKLRLYTIAASNMSGRTAESLLMLTAFVGEVLQLFGTNVVRSHGFITTAHVAAPQGVPATQTTNTNFYTDDEIAIEVTTVHAVKGQTHTSTLYMESFYQINVGGKGQYESSRIADQLQGMPLPGNAHEYVKQSLKMTYVGLSRATHLMAFAIHKSRYDTLYDGKPNLDYWDVRTVQMPAGPHEAGVR